MSQSNNGRDIHFLENFPILASVGKFLQRSAENRDGNLATLVRVNKFTWQSKEALYKELLPTFDMVYTPLWSKFVKTNLKLRMDCVSSVRDLVYFEQREYKLHLGSTSGFSVTAVEGIPRNLVTSPDGSYIALTSPSQLIIYKHERGSTPLLNETTEFDITRLKFIEVANKTLLYVFFNFRLHICHVSADKVVLLKQLRPMDSISHEIAFKAGNLVVILENGSVNSTIFRKNDPFLLEDVEDHFERIPDQVKRAVEIHDEHILIQFQGSELRTLNLNNISECKSNAIPGIPNHQYLCVRTLLAGDTSAWGKQVCILDELDAHFFFQRGLEMIPFRRVTRFGRHHSLPSFVDNIQITTKEGKTTIHVVLDVGDYYTQEI